MIKEKLVDLLSFNFENWNGLDHIPLFLTTYGLLQVSGLEVDRFVAIGQQRVLDPTMTSRAQMWKALQNLQMDHLVSVHTPCLMKWQLSFFFSTRNQKCKMSHFGCFVYTEPKLLTFAWILTFLQKMVKKLLVVMPQRTILSTPLFMLAILLRR